MLGREPEPTFARELTLAETVEFIKSQMHNIDKDYSDKFQPESKEEKDYFSKNPKEYFGYMLHLYFKTNTDKFSRLNLFVEDKSLLEIAEKLFGEIFSKKPDGLTFALMLLATTGFAGKLIEEGKCKHTKNPEEFYKLMAEVLHKKAHKLTLNYDPLIDNCWEYVLHSVKGPIDAAIKNAEWNNRKTLAYGLAVGGATLFAVGYVGLKAYSAVVDAIYTPKLG